MWQEKEITGETNWGCSVCREQWGDCLVRRPDTRPSYVPCTHKMAITNKDSVKPKRPGQSLVKQNFLLKLGGFPLSWRGCRYGNNGASIHLAQHVIWSHWHHSLWWFWSLKKTVICVLWFCFFTFTDMTSVLNVPLQTASSFQCLYPATSLLAHITQSGVYKNCLGSSITSSGTAPFSGIITYSTIEL